MKNNKIQFVENKLSDELHNISSQIHLRIKSNAEELNSRGLLNSSICISEKLNIISETIITSCKQTLISTDKLQTDWNKKFKIDELDSIGRIMITRYQSLVTSIVQNVNLSNTGINETVNIHIDNLKNNINNIVSSKIKELKLSNKIRREPASIRQVKISNLIAICAMILAIVSIIVTANK